MFQKIQNFLQKSLANYFAIYLQLEYIIETIKNNYSWLKMIETLTSAVRQIYEEADRSPTR